LVDNQGPKTVNRHEEIATERCRLRYPNEADIPHIWSASQTPGFNDGLDWEPPSSMAAIEEALGRALQSWDSGKEFSWAIESRDNHDFIGWISIRREDGDRKWSIGFWIHPTRQGQGFAKECAAAVIEYGFARLHAELITATHASWNTASCRVLDKVGMTPVSKGQGDTDDDYEWIEYEASAD
jgi:ribosomal-protein-alanine N-acetyltransferase